MEIQIREATPEDYEQIAMLNKSEMGYDYPLKDTKEKLIKLINSQTDKIFVAVVDGRLSGYVHANDYDVLYMPHFKNIMGIAVSSSYKRCGVGTKLLGAVEQWAKDTGAYGIRLVSGAERAGAHSFYSANGYECKKMQKNFKKIFKK